MLTPPERGDPPSATGLDVLVAGTASDAHTWNLVFLQLTLEELGHRVTNLGPCVPDELLLEACEAVRPRLIVLGTLNGHGGYDGIRVIQAIRRSLGLAGVAVVIGGMLGIAGPGNVAQARRLVAAGFDAAFDGASGLASFRSFVAGLLVRAGT